MEAILLCLVRDRQCGYPHPAGERVETYGRKYQQGDFNPRLMQNVRFADGRSAAVYEDELSLPGIPLLGTGTTPAGVGKGKVA